MPEIQQLLRSIAIINSPSTHRKDLENYQQLCSNNETGGKPRRASDAPSDQMSTRGISQTIHIAADLQRLACIERVAENAPHEIYVIGAPTKKQGVSTRITLM
ncbi:hypothetical protein PENNAL_c0005G12005 [Penicillium nalgiovense]|uniref:Uncharacterized protein n=1 Tax=Penicillium nalgiovense TaxID=60175 RepID=A0A1V6Z2H8_PENNA|nr:hypothetical protein PENNAL_c0005G12005 [Penicillium nalgiovense]